MRSVQGSSKAMISVVLALSGWAACGDDGSGSGGDTEAATGTADDGIALDSSGAAGSDTGTPADGSAGDETAVATGGVAPGGCGTDVLACSDGMDNDGDGVIDGDDPECTGACDNDEGSFQTGIPGDNVDCKQDCFFDGNSGQGDDGCVWSLRCDPENPGENVGCEFTDGANCDNMVTQTQECIDFCSQFVPNGCDCFGCCTIATPDGDVNVYLGSGPDCSLANLDACSSCTPSEDCGNTCDPESCEVCFGTTEPAEGCGQPECPDGQQPCVSDGEGGSDCPEGWYCLTGCCTDFTPEG
jgi:hypothetical protein